MAKRKRRKYSLEFKEEAVKLVPEQGRQVEKKCCRRELFWQSENRAAVSYELRQQGRGQARQRRDVS